MKIINYFFGIAIAMLFFQCQENVLLEVESTNSDFKTRTPLFKSAASIGEFSVLTYNIAGLLEPFSSSNPSVNTPKIAVLVNDYDIVQVQEDFNYHAALYEGDLHPYCTPTSGGMGIGDGLNTMSNFPFSDDLIRVDWDNCNGTDCLTPKGFTWLRLRIDEGVYIDFYNFHTNAGSTSSDYAARRANILQLVSYIQTNSAGNAVLIFGDSNCRYTRSEDNIREIINVLSMTDVWVQLIKEGNAPELGSAPLVCDETAILTDFSCELVDKIFYRSNNYITLTPLEFTYEDAKFRDENGDMLSDHRPVYTNFRWILNNNLKLSDQFGGPHGTSYTDVNDIPESPVVNSIGLRAGSRVDQVNLSLSNGSTFIHGGTGGTAYSINLNQGEYVKSVKLCSGQKNGHTRIFYAKFTTSSERTLSGGTTTSNTVTYTAPDGWQIVGFHGRSGDELDKVGVIYAPV
jgi:endonuclease/exonuclease/phosphatase family metal-dependent hydrolase